MTNIINLILNLRYVSHFVNIKVDMTTGLQRNQQNTKVSDVRGISDVYMIVMDRAVWYHYFSMNNHTYHTSRELQE